MDQYQRERIYKSKYPIDPLDFRVWFFTGGWRGGGWVVVSS